MASLNYFYLDMYNSTNLVVVFDGKDGNVYLRDLATVSYKWYGRSLKNNPFYDYKLYNYELCISYLKQGLSLKKKMYDEAHISYSSTNSISLK